MTSARRSHSSWGRSRTPSKPPAWPRRSAPTWRSRSATPRACTGSWTPSSNSPASMRGTSRCGPTPQDLAAWVRGVVASFGSDAEARGLTLTVQAPETLPALFDADRLDRALVNLVSNALKYTPAGGQVTVTLAVDAGRAVMTVADTGPGMAPAMLAHAFDRFARAPDAEVQEGTGLGLALARELARLHGGDVTLESAPGQGLAATLWIPLQAALPEPRPTDTRKLLEGEPNLSGAETSVQGVETGMQGVGTQTNPVEEETHGVEAPMDPVETGVQGVEARGHPEEVGPPKPPRPLVLVVDDSADVRAFVRRVLEPTCTVEEAADGVEGLERAHALVPDLVVTDLMMPRLDGLGLVRALRADPALDHVPLVVLTARAGEESRLEGLRAGVDDYLAKPFLPAELRARVANLVARQLRLKARFEATLETPAPASTPLLEASPVVVTPADEAFVARAKAAVEAVLADEAFGVEGLAEALFLSRRQLERKLRALTGASPADFIRLLRLSRAASLLAQRYGTVSEIAYACGFPNASSFARVFRERYGVPPSAWAEPDPLAP